MGICGRAFKLWRAEWNVADQQQYEQRNHQWIQPDEGAVVGTITNDEDKPIHINQLWGIEFGGGSAENGNTNQLYYTAGPANNLGGIFGVINFK